MNATDRRVSNTFRVWLTRNDGSVDDLRRLCERETTEADHPHAVEIQQNVPIYDAAHLGGLSQ